MPVLSLLYVIIILPGIRLVSVGIGDYIDKEQLVQMASNETDSYHVTSYDNLSDIYDELFDVICDSW